MSSFFRASLLMAMIVSFNLIMNFNPAFAVDLEAIEEKFQTFKLILTNKDLTNIETVKHHLSLMVEIDQEARKLIMNDHARFLIKAIDQFNTCHLKGILAIHGWPIISKFGRVADTQAWLLVQHADHDLAFQEKCLSKIEKLLPLNETNPTNFAYLFDRVAINTGKRQRYGTQVKIEEDYMELLPYEGALGELNERRRCAGLESVEVHLERVKDVYKQTKS